jgi:upstream activation factor subunit UAF30
MATPDDNVIRAWMTKLVPTVDLNTMTTKQFIAKLAETMGGVELSSKKAFIKKTLTEILDDMDDSDDDSSSGEEDMEEKPKPKRKGGGLTAVKEITPDMARFLGKSENMAARTEIVKAIWAYVRENNLQNPNDKREIILDDTLKQLFPCDRFTMVSGHVR